MTTWFSDDYAARPGAAPPSMPGARAGNHWPESLRQAGRACCCTASPSVAVVMPPAPGRSAVDLLFCQHHYRVHAQALAAAGGLAFGQDGAPLTPDDAVLVAAG